MARPFGDAFLFLTFKPFPLLFSSVCFKCSLRWGLVSIGEYAFNRNTPLVCVSVQEFRWVPIHVEDAQSASAVALPPHEFYASSLQVEQALQQTYWLGLPWVFLVSTRPGQTSYPTPQGVPCFALYLPRVPIRCIDSVRGRL